LSAFTKTNETPYDTLDDGAFPQIESDLNQYLKNYVEESETPMLKQVWDFLNRDITPSLLALKNQVAAIYNPQLVPVRSGGIIVYWVDSRFQ